MKPHSPLLRPAGILSSLLLLAHAPMAAPLLPPVYRGGVNLGTNGAQVSQDITFWKDVIYVGVEAQTCWPNQPLSSATVFAVDVRNPTNLQYLTKSSFGGCKAYGLAAFEDTLYVANWSALLRTFDVAHRNQLPQLAEFYVAGDYGWTVSVERDRAYVAEAHELAESFYILDVANPASPRLVSATDWAGSPAVAGSYSFYRDGTQFKVLNISDETAPTPAAGVNLGVALAQPQLRGDYAYAAWNLGSFASGTSGIVCVDISDPLAPREVGRWTTPAFYFWGGLRLLGDFAFLPTSGNGIFAVNIAHPTNLFSVAQFDVPYYSLELCVAGNGRHVYAGTVEGERTAGIHCWQILTQDPDDAAPGDWRNFSPRLTSWDLQYSGDALPTVASPAWKLFEGTAVWASVSNGVLRVNDTGTVSGDKVKWARRWDATSSRGATVLARARCVSYNAAGAFISNLILEDGKFVEEFSILTDKFRARYAGVEFALDGTQWHTYRITTRSNRFQVYLDEAATPALAGPLSAATAHSRVIFGSGSSPARQDVHFDYVHAFGRGAEAPGATTTDRTPDVSVDVSDLAGRGSLSLLATNTARVHWSTDGGAMWTSSGGALWNGQYEGDALPSSAAPAWHPVEGSEAYASVAGGVLRVLDTSTAANTKLKYERQWRASPTTGATVLARVRCAAAGGDTTYTGNLFVEDGAHEESLKILADRIVARNAGLTHYLDATVFRVYRLTLKGAQFQVYVDENPTPVLSGALATPSTDNRVMFGSGASAGTQDIFFDYVRYSTAGELPPGQGNAGGPVPVSVLLPPGASNGVDRCTLRAANLPLNQYSETLNLLRFSIADLEGNVGWSPVYPLRTVMVDTDRDGMDDDWERAWFGNLLRDGRADYDGDGQSDHDEFAAATDPRDARSCFKVLEAGLLANQTLRLTWSAVPGKAYQVETRQRLSSGVWAAAAGSSLVATGSELTWTAPTGNAEGYWRVAGLRP